MKTLAVGDINFVVSKPLKKHRKVERREVGAKTCTGCITEVVHSCRVEVQTYGMVLLRTTIYTVLPYRTLGTVTTLVQSMEYRTNEYCVLVSSDCGNILTVRYCGN